MMGKGEKVFKWGEGEWQGKRERERVSEKETREWGSSSLISQPTGLTSLTQAGPQAEQGNGDRVCAKTRQGARGDGRGQTKEIN